MLLKRWSWLPKHRRPTYNVCMFGLYMCMDLECLKVNVCVCMRVCDPVAAAAVGLLYMQRHVWCPVSLGCGSPSPASCLGPFFLSMIYSSATVASPHSCSPCIRFHAHTNSHIHRCRHAHTPAISAAVQTTTLPFSRATGDFGPVEQTMACCMMNSFRAGNMAIMIFDYNNIFSYTTA